MKKSYPFDELGEKACIVCGAKLKKRIEVERPEWVKCYRCYNRLPERSKDNDDNSM
jgi:hypothetical protein